MYCFILMISLTACATKKTKTMSTHPTHKSEKISSLDKQNPMNPEQKLNLVTHNNEFELSGKIAAEIGEQLHGEQDYIKEKTTVSGKVHCKLTPGSICNLEGNTYENKAKFIAIPNESPELIEILKNLEKRKKLINQEENQRKPKKAVSAKITCTIDHSSFKTNGLRPVYCLLDL